MQLDKSSWVGLKSSNNFDNSRKVDQANNMGVDLNQQRGLIKDW